jgi:hypothetical protein
LAAATARQLRVNGSAILDPHNQPLDGDRDSQPGNDFVAILKKKKVAVQSLFPTPSVQQSTSALSGVAIDEILERGLFTLQRKRKPRK